ncbi:ferritin-like domain-containing protein [Hymenobacter lutimineralis]|uniref:Ferritin-like domain-containing protein n=1 Tax=Hymenobacter lutimineralis TaxID=2606448 RepID=A0A5D6V3I2_9BACT|nr:ferritin-like domain-containing protein [Hymenobacter lutimineralis]TYZ09608.1 ferritin-like domain-containing protein [Hymenobacter lutimineralis]
MNFLQLLADLAQANPAVYTQASQRRTMLRQLSQLGGRVAATALPLLAVSTSAAKAGTRENLLDVLQLALTLEYLESDFYRTALGKLARPDGSLVSADFVPASLRADLETLQLHEDQHVAFLQAALENSGVVVPARPRFDFTGSRNGAQAALFPDVFTNFDTFLQVAQTLEDAGVRAYKGQAGFLINDNALLEAAFRIHSVEARHASHIRRLRRLRQTGAAEPIRNWVGPGLSGSPAAPASDAAYVGEDALTQALPNSATVQLEELRIGSDRDRALRSAQEAFDEPLTTAQSTALANIFIY